MTSDDWITAVAQFAKHYPGMPYLSPCWPTSDHVIPWRLFDSLYRQLEEILGRE